MSRAQWIERRARRIAHFFAVSLTTAYEAAAEDWEAFTGSAS